MLVRKSLKYLLKPNLFKYLLAFLGFLLVLSSCSSLDSSCAEMNWYELGRQDSSRGLNKKESFARRHKICPIDKDSIYAKAYDNGFSSGIMSYCNFKTGYIYSLSQMEKKVSACPDSLKTQFLKGYEIGSYMKDIQSLQNEIQQKIQTVNQKLETHDNRLSMIADPSSN